VEERVWNRNKGDKVRRQSILQKLSSNGNDLRMHFSRCEGVQAFLQSQITMNKEVRELQEREREREREISTAQHIM
jgi:hypothetical protein